ncbi:MAG: hypothetical protein IPO92_16155 [Saprospiraceae bacterium]|nr:hypothetical protein [Saprospiraceae bacterium]
MKPTLFIFMLLSFGGANSNLFSQPATKLEVMAVKNYIIDLVVGSLNGDGDFPHPWHIIQLEGVPGNGSKIKMMKLNFYAENDERIKFKPSFDEANSIAYAHFPVTEFDKYYELLKHKKKCLDGEL